MRFALIGIDDVSESIARAIAGSADHSLVTAFVSPEEAQRIAPYVQQIAPADNWESLLARHDVNAVVVASSRNSTLREEQLKRLAQDAIPLLVVHPACDLMFAYELEMMRREAGGVIVPVAPDWWHPGWQRLLEWQATKGVENSSQVFFSRSLSPSSRESVFEQFIRDAWITRRLIGPIKSVSAIGQSDGQENFLSLNVHCVSDSNVLAQWFTSLAPDQRTGVVIQSLGDTAALRIGAATVAWTFETRGAQETREQFPRWEVGPEAVARIRQAVEGQLVVPSWSDCCLDLEAADSVQKSLRRKRLVDLHTTEASEDQTFKGYMAAAGCLILSVILLGFLALAVVEGFRIPLQEPTAAAPGMTPAPRWPLWLRLWPVYPLVAFLLMQFLLLLAKGPTAKSTHVDGSQTPPEGSD